WERVALCEEGGDWSADSGRFSGGLGITRANWSAYGGGAYAPEGAMATEDQQIMVAERIQPSAPDQYGCHGW
ncbi:MAG TPA: transglycosylase family protein, partial [Acidimicrobiales bacterium]